MSTDPKEIKITNIDDNNTGWLSRYFCAAMITMSMYGVGNIVSDAIDRHTEAVKEQTKVLQEIHAPSAE